MDAHAQGWKIDRATSAEMAKRMDCTRQAVEKSAKRAGIEKGVDGKYDATKLQAAMEQGRAMDDSAGDMSTIALRNRKMELECQELAFKLAILREQYMLRSIADSAQEKAARAVIAALSSVGRSIAPNLEGKSVGRMAEMIDAANSDALRSLISKYPPEKKPADEPDD